MTTSRRGRTIRATALAPALALGLVLGLGVTAPAQASSTSKKDPRNDHLTGPTPGAIDLARVRLKTTKGKRRIQATVKLHRAVSAQQLARPGGVAVEFQKNKKTLRSVLIHTVNGKLRGTVCSYNTQQQIPPPRNCSRVKVKKVNPTTYRAVVPRKKIKKGAKVLRWFGSSLEMRGTPVIDVLRPRSGGTFRWKL